MAERASDPNQSSSAALRARANSGGACDAPPSTATTYGYDGRGNRLTTTTPTGALTTDAYDAADRLVRHSAATTTSYSYDGDGLRTKKTDGVGNRRFTWSSAGPLPLLLSETAAAGTSYFVYGPNGQVLEEINGTTVLTYHGDRLGSVRAVTDEDGSIVSTADYDAEGRRTATTGVVRPFGFAGEYHDEESGYLHLRARYYDPATAQFLTRDPLVEATGEPYAYAGNDAVNRTDPSGLCPWCIPVAILTVEVGLSVWDAYEAFRTAGDDCASGREKFLAAGIFVLGVLAPGGGYGALDDLSASGARIVSEDGLTRAGQKLEQHQGGLFGKVAGSAAEKSAQGQFVLDDILTHPGTRVVPVTTGNFKGGWRYIDPAGRGATFDAYGQFQYFGEHAP